MTRRLKLDVMVDGYRAAATVSPWDEVLLEGGLPRQRIAQVGQAYTANCTFVCNRIDYEYLKAFERVIKGTGERFFLYLVTDKGTLTDHITQFSSEGVILQSHIGGKYVASAQVYGVPLTNYPLASDIALVDAF